MVILPWLVWFPLPAAGATLRVNHPASIQQAIGQSHPGDTIEIGPGTYHEALHVDKENITLLGVIENGAWPLLDGKHVLNDGVIATGSGFRIENLRIERYIGNGVSTQGARNVTIRRLIVRDTGIYGIYPQLGFNVVVEDCVVSEVADAGIYVSTSQFADVRRNYVYRNVAGIEFENSMHVLVEHNTTDSNTAGILIFTLPGLATKQAEDVIVRYNTIVNNNYRNFGAAGSVVANVPPGSGAIVLAADKVVFHDNIFQDNSTAAIIFADLDAMPGMTQDPEVDPLPDKNRVGKNLFYRNGKKSFADLVWWYHFILKNLWAASASPKGTTEDLLPRGADVMGTEKGNDNCLSPGLGATTLYLGHFGSCAEDLDTAKTLTMLQPDLAPADQATSDPGAFVYASVCSGCHAMDFRLIGPPIREIQAKYRDNPDGIVAFATAPRKVRDDLPPMPPQAHLGQEKLRQVARYLLDRP